MERLDDKQMLEQFKMQEKDLLQKLDFIRLAIKTYGGDTSIANIDIKTNNIPVDYNKANTWIDKIFLVIASINGGTVDNIAEELIKQEPELSSNKEKLYRRVTIIASRLSRGKVKGKEIKHRQHGKKYFYYI